MSRRIETQTSKDNQDYKFSQNETSKVVGAGVDIGSDEGAGGSNVSVDQVVTEGREVAGVTVNGERTPILVPNEGAFVQSDWDEQDTSADAYIKNKPNLANVATSGDYSDLQNTPDLSNFVVDANYVHTDNNYNNGSKAIVDGVPSALAGKVDKVSGKDLSDNNYTNTDKAKLTNLKDIYAIGANLTLDPNTNTLSADAQSITVDSAMSSTSENPVQNKVITAAMGYKVDKVNGKGLSTEDYTTSEKNKLAGIDQNAQVNVIETISVNSTGVSPDINKNVDISVPTKTSDLNNDSGFITKAVNDLTNYYLKSDTYTKTEVDALIAAITTINILVVQTLPTQNISTSTIYFVPKATASSQNVYDEYINLDGTTAGWELIGDTQIDLTNYIQKSLTAGLVKNDGTIDTNTYATTTDLADKVDKVPGKGLSTEDYTTAEQTKLSGIEAGAEVNDIVSFSVNGTAIQPDANRNVNLVVGITVLSYGTSSWADFIAAYNTNSIIFCRASSDSDPSVGTKTRLAVMAYVNSESNPTEVEFQYYRSVANKNITYQGDEVYLYKLTSSGTWSVTTRYNYTRIIAGSGLTGSYSTGSSGAGKLTLDVDPIDFDTVTNRPTKEVTSIPSICTPLPIPSPVTYGGFTPIGTVIAVMGNSAPRNYLVCDGTVYNITDYPELAGYFEKQFGSKNYFGGDGTTTFAVPDLQGEFLRGSGTNSHADQGDGATVGTHQDATELPYVFGASSSYSVAVGQKGSITNADTVGASAKQINLSGNQSSGNYNQSVTVRPTNTSVLYCISVKNIYMDAASVYSEEEKVVGQWIDGKPIYQKTVYTASLNASGTDTVIAHGISNLDHIINAFGYTYGGAGTSRRSTLSPYFNNGNWQCSFYINDTNVVIQIGSSFYTAHKDQGAYITLQYTKTTD